MKHNQSNADTKPNPSNNRVADFSKLKNKIGSIRFFVLIKKHFRLILLFFFGLLPLLPLGYTNFAWAKQVRNFFPNDPNISFYPYSDTSEQGNTIIDSFSQKPTRIQLKYTLGDKAQNPYVGFSTVKDDAYIELRNFDLLNLEIEASQSQTLSVVLSVAIDGVTKENQYDTFCPLQYSLRVDVQRQLYQIKLSDFSAPNWWFQENNLTLADNLEIDLNQIHSINIEQNAKQMIGRMDTIVLSKLSAGRDRTGYAVYSGIGALFYYGLMGIWVAFIWLKNKKQVQNQVVIGYQNIQIKTPKNRDLEKLVAFIGQNYSDTNLTVEKLSKSTDIPQQKVPVLIKEAFQLTFPKYLNKIRLSESKRLLVETQLPIIDVAMTVGYNNVSHFNHLFKKETGQPPSAYRKAMKK